MSVLWSDKKRPFLGLPLSFTKYSMTEEKLLIETGIFNKNEEEVRLYRILDVTLKRSFGERLFGLGTIHCCSADKSAPEFDIVKVKNPSMVKDMLSDMIEEERERKRVSMREFSDGDHDGDDLDAGCIDHE